MTIVMELLQNILVWISFAGAVSFMGFKFFGKKRKGKKACGATDCGCG